MSTRQQDIPGNQRPISPLQGTPYSTVLQQAFNQGQPGSKYPTTASELMKFNPRMMDTVFAAYGLPSDFDFRTVPKEELRLGGFGEYTPFFRPNEARISDETRRGGEIQRTIFHEGRHAEQAGRGKEGAIAKVIAGFKNFFSMVPFAQQNREMNAEASSRAFQLLRGAGAGRSPGALQVDMARYGRRESSSPKQVRAELERLMATGQFQESQMSPIRKALSDQNRRRR